MFIKKYYVIALVVASASGITGVAHAAGNTATDFTATIDVTSDNQCGMTVTPPTDTAFTAGWTSSIASGTATLTNTSTNHDPRIITVVSDGGDACTLNNMSVHTTVNADQSLDNIPVKSFGNNGGSWGVVPYLADFMAYQSKYNVIDGDVYAHFPDGTKKELGAVDGHEGDEVTIGKSKLKMMSDSYFGSAVESRMIDDNGLSGDVTFSAMIGTRTNTQSMHIAEVGIGAAIATMPVDATGKPDIKVAADGDTAHIPFTVTITQA